MEAISTTEMVARWDAIIKSGGKCSQEEHALLQRMTAANFARNVGSDLGRHPLSLVDPAVNIPSTTQLTGTEREYLNSIERHASENTKFQKALEQRDALARQAAEQKVAAEEEKALDREIMKLHLEVAKLQKEHDHRRTVISYLHELEKMPAAQADFLLPETMYEDCSPMPEMPKEMIEGFAVDHTATDARAEELLQGLKKHVLRSRLMAQRQHADYERKQAEKPLKLDGLSPEVKLRALDAVKNALINWIEVQLAKVGEEGNESDPDQQPSEANVEYDHEAVMSGIQQKYQHHIVLRQQILDQMAQLDHVKEQIQEAVASGDKGKKHNKSSMIDDAPEPSNTLDAHLLIPYIERLQSLANQQKSMMREKSQINASLSKQQDSARQILEQLARESKLLPKYPLAREPTKQQPDFEDVASLDDRLKMAEYVRPWIYAADAAKLATLEEVAENVVAGMDSVDEARTYLEQICKLLNIPSPMNGETTTVESPEEAGLTPRSQKKAQAKDGSGSIKTIWDILDGNLGSINE